MLTATVYSSEGDRSITQEEISENIATPGLLVWVDLVDPVDGELSCLQDELGLHALAVEDARKHGQRPKLRLYESHAFIVGYASSARRGRLVEVDLFVGPDWLVTVRDSGKDGDTFDLDATRQHFARFREDSVEVGFLLYTVLDDMVDGYFDLVERAENALEVIETDLFADEAEADLGSRDRRIQQQLLDLRRELIALRRRVVPFRDVILALLRGEVEWLSHRSLVYFQDVLDHILRLADQIDNERELLGNVVDAHLALQANHMNEVMKKMTSWGAILIVATLIAGIYGMNFKNMPELGWRYGYFAALGSMLVITGGLWLYFKRKDWL